MSSKKRLLLAVAGMSLLAACSKPVLKHYYTLELPPAPVPKVTGLRYDLWVHDVTMAPIYNRPQIVYRRSQNELQFHAGHNWADRPQRMMTQLLVQAFAGSGLFRSVSSRLGTTPPEYHLETTVHALEELDGGDIWYAHVAMSLRLSRFDDNSVVWQYDFDEKRPLDTPDVGLTVRAMSEIIEEQIAIIRPDLASALARAEGRAPPEQETPGVSSRAEDQGTPSSPGMLEAAEPAGERAGIPNIEPSAGQEEAHEPLEIRKWRQSAQYASDTSKLRPGKGAIFLPSLSGEPQREPKVDIYRDTQLVSTGSMAQRISLVPGTYEVHIGSGTLSQRTIRTVTVEEGKVTIVPPDWAVLDVSVVDDKFIPFRGSYELINMDNLEFYGVGYGADEELGEETQAWVLPPGLYKIVKPGSTYRARTNFATVLLTPGAYVPFTLVLDASTQDFLGAGVTPQDMTGPVRNERWKLHSMIGGDLLFNDRSTGFSAPPGTTLSMNIFSDNLVKFQFEKHLWTNRLEIEEGFSLQSQQTTEAQDGADTASVVQQSLWEGLREGNRQTTQDRLYLNSIYIYELLPWAGPYARVRAETALTHRYSYFDEPTYVVQTDSCGEILEDPVTREPRYAEQVTEVEIAPPFAPLEFKQGVGINFRLFHTTFIDLDLRVGVGMTQYLPRGFMIQQDATVPATASTEITDEHGEGTGEYQDLDVSAIPLRRPANSFVVGPESAILASARFTRSLQFTTEFEAIMPSQGARFTSLSWRNSLSLQLGSYTTLVYTLNLERNRDLYLGGACGEGAAELDLPLATEHSVQLRFWYSPL